MSETKKVKTALGELEFDQKNNRYIMSSDQLYKRMEDAGLVDAKKVIKAVNDAENIVLADLAHFVSNEAAKTMKDTTLSAGKMPYRMEAATIITKDVNVPGRDGQPTSRKTIFGPTSAKVIKKTPPFIKDDELLRKNSDSIEKEWMKANGNRIKIA